MASNKINEETFRFETIEACKAYHQLRKLPAIPRHETLRLNSIFNSAQPVLDEIQVDVANIYKVIDNDVQLETQQMDQVEAQIRKSLKKISHKYYKTIAARTKNQQYRHHSKQTDRFCSQVDNIENDLKQLKTMGDSIIDNFVQIDNTFMPTQGLFSVDRFSQKHYPLLFELITRNYPERLVTRDNEITPDVASNDSNFGSTQEVAQDQPRTDTPANKVESTAVNNFPTEHEVQPPSLDDEIASINNMITHHTINQIKNLRLSEQKHAFLPPTFRKTSKASTSATLENIVIKDMFETNGEPTEQRLPE